MKSLFVLLIVVASAATSRAENWPQWRGPHHNGSSTDTNLPTEFSQTENIAWRTEMPGPSAATPIVWEDKIFVSSTDVANDSVKALCYDRESGKLLWQHDVAKGTSQDTRSYYSAPSPATDGNVVVFFFGNGDLITYDLDGKELWSTNIGPFAFQWTFSTSPLLFDGKLYMQVLQRNEPVNGRAGATSDSYLLALEPTTGTVLWQHVRPSQAVMESLEAFTTPVPFTHDGRSELLIAGGDALTGHDPETGAELWRWGTWNPSRIGHWRLVPSPVAGDDVILVCAPKKDPVYAVRAGGKGRLGDDDLLWTSARQRAVSSDVPTPAYYDGDFFILNKDRKNLSRVHPQTGEVKWTTKKICDSFLEASPTAADGKIYVVNFDGEVTIVNAEDGSIMNTIPMEPTRDRNVVRSSIVVSDGQLLIRTNSYLYCVGT